MEDNEVVHAFTAWMRDKRGAPKGTVEKYGRISEHWRAFLPTPLVERTADDVEAFCARPRRGGQSVAAATIANEVAVLGSLYRFGQRLEGWTVNPPALAGKPKVHNRQPRPVTDAVWRSVWLNDSLPADARVALGLGYWCGLRRAEITGLHANQVWGGALVNFTRKGGGEDRFDYRDVLDHFAAFMPELEPLRLEQPLHHFARTRGTAALLPWGAWTSPKALNVRMSRWLADCGLQSAAFTPHALRHSFATNLMRTGVPLDVACDLCNHSSPTITMRYIRTGGGRLAALRGSTATVEAV